jgi:hypothetical protein
MQERLMQDIDERIRNMPPIPIVPAADAPAPDPNEVRNQARMEAIRMRRDLQRRENQLRAERRQRVREAAQQARASQRNTTQSFAPKRKLDLD